MQIKIMKKIFYVALFLFVLTLLFLGVYNFAFVKNPNNPVVDQVKKDTTKAQTTADIAKTTAADTALIKEITNGPTVGANIASDNEILFFTSDGALKRVTIGGGAEETVMDGLSGTPTRAIWSPTGEKALVQLSTSGLSRWSFVDVSAKTVTPLKSEMSSPTWTSLGDRIFYLYTDGVSGKTALNSSKPDGSDWRAYVAPITSRKYYLSAVPKSAAISFWTQPDAFTETSLVSFTPTGTSVKKLFSGKFGANYLWSSDGNHLLISNTFAKGGGEFSLGITNANGGEFHPLNVPTFVSKVAWSSDGKSLYYALPLGIPSGAVLPNDYFGRPIHTSDSFWKMDIGTGKTDRIIDSRAIEGKDFDSIDLVLSPDEKYLFFTNRVDGHLYRIELPQ